MNYTIENLANGARAVVNDKGITLITYEGEDAQADAEFAVRELQRAYEVEL